MHNYQLPQEIQHLLSERIRKDDMFPELIRDADICRQIMSF